MNNNLTISYLFERFKENDFDSFISLLSSLSYTEKRDFFYRSFTVNNKKQLFLSHFIDYINQNENFLKTININFLKYIFKNPIKKRNKFLEKQLYDFNNKLIYNFSFNSPDEHMAFRSFMYLNDYIKKFGNKKNQQEMNSLYAFLLNKDNFLHVVKNFDAYKSYLEYNWTPNFVYDFLDNTWKYNKHEMDFIFNHYSFLKEMKKEQMEDKLGWVKLHENLCYILKLHSEHHKYNMFKYYNLNDFPHIAPLIEKEMLIGNLKNGDNIYEVSKINTDNKINRRRL